ncbi:MAG: hypothetical protein JWO89_1217 [Verrucomicrobiaceae bacterium]|nr:hypothetical protein [Verrucomicrobiaceae bacterium]
MNDVVLILRRCALRHWRLAWKQQLMLLAILALGTGVHVAMKLANRSALAGFERFTQTITSESDWTLRAAAGPLQEEWLREMRAALGGLPVNLIPAIEATVTPPALPSSAEVSIGAQPTWRLLGMDLIGLQNLRASFPAQTNVPVLAERSVFVSQGMARNQGWKEGSEVKVVINDEVISLKVAGIMPVIPDAPAPPDDVLLMDLPEAQRLLHREGEIDRVEVLSRDGAAFSGLREQSAILLKQAAKDRWQLLGHEDRHALAGSMTAAFRLNLNVLSLLALLVGGYLMFQALDGVVIRRREEIAVLRSLGVRERSIQMAFLAEAALLGLVAGILGDGLGWVGAQAAVMGVARTMTALYGASSATYASLNLDEALLGVAICIGTSLVAAWWPARVAAATPAAQILGRHSMHSVSGKIWRVEVFGVMACITALGLAELGPLRINGMRIPLAAYTAALFWLMGAGLAAGGLLQLFRAGENPVRRLAFSHLRQPSIRHRFAVAALTSAITMSTGMAVMIASFDNTMRGWIVRSMKADIYVSSAGAQSASSTSLISAATVDEIRAMPGVQEVAVVRHMAVNLPDGPVHAMGGDMAFAQRRDLHAWVQAPAQDWWYGNEPAALINESLGERLQKHRGDLIEMPTPAGLKPVRIAGVYADYGNERGTILLHEDRFREWFHNEMAWRVAVMLKPGADAETMRAALQHGHPGLSVFTQAHLREEALRIFRQTFAVTYALEAVGVIVAVAGLGLALASLMLDRRKELATLRAIGFTTREASKACAWEGFGLAVSGVVAGIIAGVWLGWLLIERVNKQSFGWTLTFHFPGWQIAAMAVAVIGTGIVVSAFVGRWSSTLTVDREE